MPKIELIAFGPSCLRRPFVKIAHEIIRELIKTTAMVTPFPQIITTNNSPFHAFKTEYIRIRVERTSLEMRTKGLPQERLQEPPMQMFQQQSWERETYRKGTHNANTCKCSNIHNASDDILLLQQCPETRTRLSPCSWLLRVASSMMSAWLRLEGCAVQHLLLVPSWLC
jgi:hypothetical protein